MSKHILTFKASLFIVMTLQLSVENEMAKRAAATKEKIEAKHKVTALQKAIFRAFLSLFEV